MIRGSSFISKANQVDRDIAGGRCIVCSGSVDVAVEIYALNPSGSVVGQESNSPARIALPAHNRTAGLIEQLIPSVRSRQWDGGFVFARTTNGTPIFGIELFFLRGNDAIANVPAGVLPPAVDYKTPTAPVIKG